MASPDTGLGHDRFPSAGAPADAQGLVPLLPRLKDKMDAKIARSEYPETVKYDLQTRLQGLPKHYKLCHGDFCPGNVIVTSEGVPYIIDWAHATQGNDSAFSSSPRRRKVR